MAPYNRGPECSAIVGLFLGLTWTFFSMRMYVKAFLTRSWGVDDLFLIIAIILFTTYSTCALLGVKYGTGKHITDIPFDNIHKALHFWFLCEIFYTLTTAFIRLSIAIFLVRIIFRRAFKIIIYITMTAITGFSIFYFFLVLFQCSPVDYFWNQYKGEKGECMNPAAVPDASIAHSALSFTADWTLGLLPIAFVWTLKMNRRTKVSLACILALGLLAGIAAIIRIPYIKILTITDDFLYATTDVGIWSTVEAGLGIIAASAYTLRPLFRSILQSRSGYPDSGKLSRTTSGGLRKRSTRGSGGRASQQRNQQQQRRQEPGIPMNSTQGFAGRGTPAARENENEDPIARGAGDGDGDGRGRRDDSGIQVHRSFAVREEERLGSWAEEEEVDEDGEEAFPMPWGRREGMGSNASIV